MILLYHDRHVLPHGGQAGKDLYDVRQNAIGNTLGHLNGENTAPHVVRTQEALVDFFLSFPLPLAAD